MMTSLESPSQDPFDFHPALATTTAGSWFEELSRVGAATDLHQCEGIIITEVDDTTYVLASDGDARHYPVFDLDMRRVKRALAFIHRTQEHDGSWWGRWGVNYIYGTWSVLSGLRAIGDDLRQPYVRRAVQWLKDRQNEDGGWGFNIIDESAMFSTCLNYTSLRLLGEVQQEENDGLAKGREWILSHGTATAAPRP